MKNRFSLRTLMLAVLGFSLLCGLFAGSGTTPAVAHTLLVLAFAIPGGSLGYDLGRSSRSLAIGVCVSSVAGTLVVGGAVLLVDWWTVLRP
jgi:hypothetical protein